MSALGNRHLPHGGNLYQVTMPAGIVVGNGTGKLTGNTRIVQFGAIHTPIVLTSTQAVPRAANGILDWTLARRSHGAVISVNPVVVVTNEKHLNDSRRRALALAMIQQALAEAEAGPVGEGAMSAATGTVALACQGGIGISSRLLV